MSEEFIAAAYWEKHLQTANTQNPFRDKCIFPVGKFLFSDFKHTGDVHHVTYGHQTLKDNQNKEKKDLDINVIEKRKGKQTTFL